MRLLNVSTLQLESFLGTEKPPYAILSHTWEPDGEILFEDLQTASTGDYREKSGFAKVMSTCNRALRDGYQYVWIDTCCIDKSSSAELSEAINSMFRWYQQSRICYAYLSDVPEHGVTLFSSRWLTRGWTLQELIAPKEVLFFDSNWNFVGTRSTLASQISEHTRIQEHVLVRTGQALRGVLRSISVAQRMIWASERQTTREEDIAYSLMGLFDVNMPLLYGEGDKAFLRLQEAIIHGSEDQSILAFRINLRTDLERHNFESHFSPILAPSVADFCDNIYYQRQDPQETGLLRLEHGNISLRAYIAPLTSHNWPLSPSRFNPTHVVFLDCVCGDDFLSRPGLLVQSRDSDLTLFKRCGSVPVLVKATADRPEVVIIIEGVTSFHVPSLNNKAGILRKQITIEADGNETATIHVHNIPIELNYASIAERCSIGSQYPGSQEHGHRSGLINEVGIISFKYESEYFFVVWGSYSGEPWCTIHSLMDFRFVSKSKQRLSDEECMDSVVQFVQDSQDVRQDLFERFDGLSFAANSITESPEFLVGRTRRLAIRGYCAEVNFLDRKMFQITLVVEQFSRRHERVMIAGPR